MSKNEQTARRMMACVAAGDRRGFEAEYGTCAMPRDFEDCAVVVAAAQLEQKPIKYSSGPHNDIVCSVGSAVSVQILFLENGKARNFLR